MDWLHQEPKVDQHKLKFNTINKDVKFSELTRMKG